MKAFLFIFLSTVCFSYGMPLTAYAQRLSKAETREVVRNISTLLGQHYVLKEKRTALVADFLKKTQSSGYQQIQHPDSLAKRLTKDLQEVSHDKHLYVQYTRDDKPTEVIDWDAWEKEERHLEKKLNYGFTEAQILDGNVGYLKIVEFMHPQRGMQTAVSVLKFLENAEGLIIDLTGNGGGYSGLMQYLLSHYFEGAPTHISTTIYSEKDKHPDKLYTSDLIYGKTLVNTPLYILIDKNTGSAAEFLACTLQSFGKAKVVGEPSAGAAHMNSYFPLPHNFRVSIATAAPINPITNTNWEGSGVKPDELIAPDRAKQKALALMLNELRVKEQ